MEQQPLLIPCRISPEVFRSFTVFELFRRQKRWRSPALFAAILTASALVCLLLGKDKPQSGLIGAVLLVIGLGVPLVSLASLFSSIDKQTKALHLDGERIVYTVRLDGEGIRVENSKTSQSFPWTGVAFSYRLPQCVALYPTPDQAFLLPAGDSGKEAERAWEYITSSLPPEKVFDRSG